MRSILKQKKGSLNLLVPAILGLIFAAIVLVFGLVISQELRDTQGAGTDAFIAANKTMVGLGKFGDYWEIIVLGVVISVVIGLLLAVFGGTRQK